MAQNYVKAAAQARTMRMKDEAFGPSPRRTGESQRRTTNKGIGPIARYRNPRQSIVKRV